MQMNIGVALQLIRPHQWLKNGFILLPLFFTPLALSWNNLGLVFIAVFAFCAISSAVYIVNDVADREADRLHSSKKHRPLAAGTISLGAAIGLMIALVLAGGLTAFWLSPAFLAVCAVYVVMNVAYSFWLKHYSPIDVIIIAFGFVLRIHVGAIIINVEPTNWLQVCTFLLAMFLALAKRRDDLIQNVDNNHRTSLKGYNTLFIDMSISIILSTVLTSYILYTTNQDAIERMGSDQLHFTIPFVLAGILRYLQITYVEKRSGSPTKVLLRDRVMIVSIVGWLAVFGYIIYSLDHGALPKL
jgi:decaprenyl-phosphate phosphoribosyltransferase